MTYNVFGGTLNLTLTSNLTQALPTDLLYMRCYYSNSCSTSLIQTHTLQTLIGLCNELI